MKINSFLQAISVLSVSTEGFIVDKQRIAAAPSLEQQQHQMGSYRYQRRRFSSSRYSTAPKKGKEEPTSPPSIANVLTGVVAPLKRIGPYTCLTLKFPKWNKNDTTNSTATVDFMVDTGANVNSIDARIVQENQLPEFSFPTTTKNDDASSDTAAVDPSSIPLIGSTGGTATTSSNDNLKTPRHHAAPKTGKLHLLGDCQLAGLPPPDYTFLRHLVAASLPYASPVGVGVLGLPFLWSFPAGVEFDWHGTNGDLPTIIFYYGKELPQELAKTDDMLRVPLQAMVGGLLTMEILVNGRHKLRALLDTGSPVTVLTAQACQELGIQVFSSSHDAPTITGGAAAVKITGVDGGFSQLVRSTEPVTIQLHGDEGKVLSLGMGHVWNGDLAGIRMLQQFQHSDVKGPTVVLGLDFLQNAYRMILCAPSNTAWFEELDPGFVRKYA